jgi:nitrite reductase/ring-hydroxylating ferredoxin subunit
MPEFPHCSRDRRKLLAGLLSLPAMRLALAQDISDKSINYRALREPVELPAPAEIWTPAAFKAWLEPQPSDGLAMPLLLLHGIVLRAPAAAGDGGTLHALCRLCPHEICEVDLLEDPSQIRLDSGAVPAHPLFFCVCHESVFDPVMDGAHISGPAPRGLYRFAFETAGNRVRITGVEEAVLRRLGEGV